MKYLNTTPLLAVAACLLAGSPAFSQDNDRDGASSPRDNPSKAERQEPRIRSYRADQKNLPPAVQEAMERAMRQSIQRTPWVDAPAADAPWRIGVMTEPLNPSLRIHLGIPKETGVMIREVVKESPAAKAGLQPTDIILAAGDRRIGNLETLKDVVQKAGKTGNPLTLSVIHEGKRKQVRISPDGPQTMKEPTEHRQPDSFGPLIEKQNQRLEEMNNQLKRMRAQFERQQDQIESLKKQISEHAKVDSPSERPRPRPRERD